MRYKEKDHPFFERAPDIVAKELLGKLLCSGAGKFRITEVEAYFWEDPACYGHGKRAEEATKAMRPLFGPKGICCAFGGMLLITCGRKGKPDNVLIRGAGNGNIFCDGPWKVYETLRTKEAPRAQDLMTSDIIWLEDDGAQRESCKTKRVRVAGEWNDKPLRFIAI